jgi:hypothetical protein
MKRMILTLVLVGSLAYLGFSVIPAAISGQAAAEVFTATATAKDATRSAAEPVKIVLNAYLTDAERDAAVAALKTGGTTGLQQALEKMKDLGTIEVKGTTTAIKYAYSRSMGPDAGRIVTLVTAKPILYVGGNAAGAKPKAGYDVAIALLILDSNEKGDGEINPAAKLKMDDQGAIVTDDYGAVKVWLKNVAKAK